MIPRNVSCYDSVAYEAGEAVKASPGVVHRISGFNAHTSPVWIQLLEASAIPTNGTVPALILYVGATASFDFDLSVLGRYCKTGITVCSSSTGPTLTISGDTVWLNVQYT